jgi:hypothetical protein
MDRRTGQARHGWRDGSLPNTGPRGSSTRGYPRLLTIAWAFDAEGAGSLPSEDESEAMGTFEDRFCDAVECDALAVLTAVLTFDGARQWVFYTSDTKMCGLRLEAMPQETEPYPIELVAKDDPEWRYLRDEILSRVPKEHW